MHATDHPMTSPHSEHTGALLRHFADLRDGSHGAATSRQGKERLFAEAVALLDPYARQALEEIDGRISCSTPAVITATGVRRSSTAGLIAVWALAWPQQRTAHIKPIVIPCLLRHRISASAPTGRHRRRLAAEHIRRAGKKRPPSSPRYARSRPQRSTTSSSRPAATTESSRPLRTTSRDELGHLLPRTRHRSDPDRCGRRDRRAGSEFRLHRPDLSTGASDDKRQRHSRPVPRHSPHPCRVGRRDRGVGYRPKARDLIRRL